MNANRLINMIFRLVLRKGLSRLAKGSNPDPNAKRAQQSARIARRMNKL